MPKIALIRHLSGSKAGTVEHVQLEQRSDLLIGRDPRAGLRYDATRDDLVSHAHARIAWSGAPAPRFTIEDLGSTNGTYVNGERVRTKHELKAHDTVRLGRTGPAFVFDYAVAPGRLPAPASLPGGTRTVLVSAQFIGSVFHVRESVKSLALLLRVLPSPIQQTMAAVNADQTRTAFRLIAVAYVFYALALEELGATRQFFMHERIGEILFVLGFLVFSYVQYKLLRRLCPACRPFRSYLTMCAIVGGTTLVLLTVVAVCVHWNESLAGVLFLGAVVYACTHSLRTAHVFWNTSYPKICVCWVVALAVALLVGGGASWAIEQMLAPR